jgi:hypothetical protein
MESTSTRITTPLAIAAAASGGAGLVHAAAAGTHNGDSTLSWLFAATAAAQLAWAALVLVRPLRLVVVGGVLLNGGALLAWALSRTVGLFGSLAEVEAVGTQDLLAASLGGVAAVAAGVALVRRIADRPAGLVAGAVAGSFALALALPAMAAEHTHGPSHEHAHGETAAASAHDHAQDTEHEHTDEVTATPVVSLDDSRLSKAQRARGTELLETTREAMAAFPDEAAVVAAGYRSIGDGRRPGSFEHFINPAYRNDGKELDPSAIESFVLQRQDDGTKKVMSAMYILETGATMDDVPDIAGELTVWHDHQNLCWDPSGQRLAGVLVNGVCTPGGVLRATAPMIHVWLENTPCGPFSGIEGHGGSCAHTH